VGGVCRRQAALLASFARARASPHGAAGREACHGGKAGARARKGCQRRHEEAEIVNAIAVEHRSFCARTWSGPLALWGGFIGLLPHVLHHIGPLAGAALRVSLNQ
jgi:hypothetical protein